MPPAAPPVAVSPDPPANALPPGTRLHEFEILGVLGVGGFGIVYRAMDHALEREVAIKEYMPSSLAGRTATLHVSLRSSADAETFALGLRSFVNEARLLARFDHPSLLKVYRFWEQHDTAYMAMPVYRGRTLRAVRHAMQGPPDEATLRALLVPLLGAIELLHGEGVYHRDIAPDNILVEPDGRPVLLDFGAARRVIGDRSQALTAILKPAYAPIEQYAEASASRQGPWTDLYALGATLHFLLTGAPPPPATARALHDDLPPLASRSLPGVDPTLCAAVDWMLATRPGDRPQSVAALRAVLDGRAPVPSRGAGAVPDLALDLAPAATMPTVPMPTVPMPTVPMPTVPMASPPAAAASADAPTRVERPAAAAPSPAPPASPAPSPPGPAGGSAVGAWPGERRARGVAPMALGLLVAGAAALAWWLTRAPAADGAAGAAAPAASAAADPARVAAAAPASATMPGTPAAQGPVPSATPTTASPGPAASPADPAARPEPAARAERPPARPPVRPLAPGEAQAAAPRAGTDTAAATPPPPAAAPAPAPVAASVPPASGAAPAAAALAAAVSDEPSALCGKRVLLALVWCMERECARADQKDHPACRKWFATQRQRPSP